MDNNSKGPTHSPLSNAPLVDHIVFARNNGSAVMTTSNQYDYLNRLTGKSSALNFNYQYNSAGQRTRVTQLADGSYWVYGYDALGQLTSANKYFWDNTPVAGQQFGSSTLLVGERPRMEMARLEARPTFLARVGRASRRAKPATLLNPHKTSKTLPGYVNIMGLALAPNPVSVNGSAADRKWEYFWKELAVTDPFMESE